MKETEYAVSRAIDKWAIDNAEAKAFYEAAIYDSMEYEFDHLLGNLLTEEERIFRLNPVEITEYNEQHIYTYTRSISVTPIVRCKDCKHNSLNRISGNTYCDLGIGLYQLCDFCSLGERKADE